MRYRIASVVGLLAAAIAMSWRSELSSVAARAVMAAIAFSFFGLALSGLIRSRANNRALPAGGPASIHAPPPSGPSGS